MKHEAILNIVNPKTDEAVSLNASFDIADLNLPANSPYYGNGKCLTFRIGASGWSSFDMRYDIRYKPDTEKEFIETYLRENVYLENTLSFRLVSIQWIQSSDETANVLASSNRIVRMYRNQLMSFHEAYTMLDKGLATWRVNHPNRVRNEDIAKVLLDKRRTFDKLIVW